MKTALCSSRIATLAVAVGLGAILAMTPLHGASAANLAAGSYWIQYWASPGERNNVTLSVVGANYVITDTGASSTVGNPWGQWGPCRTSGSTITCPTAGVTSISLDGGDMNDTITVEASVPVGVTVVGGAGDDMLTVQGSGTNDTLYGGEGVDTLSSGGGDDYLTGGPGNDILNGGAGNDTLAGEDGTDDLVAGDGDDRVDPGLGVLDDVFGGAGRDTVLYERGAAVDVSLDNQPNDGEPSEIDNVRDDVEVVHGGNGDDVLTGSAGRNTLNGGWGNDTLNGGDGNDRLHGEHGHDLLRGDAGDDFIDGGLHGADVFSGGTGSDYVPLIRDFDVFVSLDNVANDGEAGEGDNVGSDVEEVTTGGGDDVLVGSASANEFSTGAGVDDISGGGGSDGLLGGSGRDVINAGPGVDSIYGEAGADTINSKDKSKDYVSCGGSFDTVTRNTGDQIMVDCERLS